MNKKSSSLEVRVQVSTRMRFRPVLFLKITVCRWFMRHTWSTFIVRNLRSHCTKIPRRIERARTKEKTKTKETAVDRLYSLCRDLYSLCQGNSTLTTTLKILLNSARARYLFPDLFLTIFILVPRAACSSWPAGSWHEEKVSLKFLGQLAGFLP